MLFLFLIFSSFLLKSLLHVSFQSLQGEKVRRRNEWSNWIPKSLDSESASIAGNSVNNDQNENKTDSPLDRKTELLPSYGSSVDSLPLTPDTMKSSINNFTEQSKDSEEQRGVLGIINSGIELACQPNAGNDINVLNSEPSFLATSLGAESAKSVISKNGRNKKMQVLSNPKVKNFCESSSEFSSTFMLDEELELEQKSSGHDHPSTAGRYLRILLA